MAKKILYILLKNGAKIIMFFYKPIIVGKENIPKKGKILFAGNHTNNLDGILLFGVIPRQIYYLAKNSLFKGFLKPIMKGLDLIPVNRGQRDEQSKKIAINYLEKNKAVVIFPEGTINRTEKIIMPFKYGAVSIANKAESQIIPFAIVNEYKFLKRSVKIIFGKAYKVTADLKKENAELMQKVTNLMKEGKKDVK